MAYRILSVENTREIQEQISNYFIEKSHGEMVLDLAEDGYKGIEMLYQKVYDLVLLDVMLPDCSGFEVCRELRKRSDCPVIFLTALNSKENILQGYQAGADDYMTKPFYVEELFAKCRALIRRSKMLNGSDRIVCGGIMLDEVSMVVYADNRKVELPTKEYFLLKTLMERPEKVFSREQLLLHVWGYDYEGNERVVDNHIKNIRKSLGTQGKQIRTIIGRGYVLTGDCSRKEWLSY